MLSSEALSKQKYEVREEASRDAPSTPVTPEATWRHVASTSRIKEICRQLMTPLPRYLGTASRTNYQRFVSIESKSCDSRHPAPQQHLQLPAMLCPSRDDTVRFQI